MLNYEHFSIVFRNVRVQVDKAGEVTFTLKQKLGRSRAASTKMLVTLPDFHHFVRNLRKVILWDDLDSSTQVPSTNLVVRRFYIHL